MNQLKKYDTDFKNLKVSKHDMFLFAPEHENEALGILKFDYLDEIQPFERNFFLLVYSIGLLANTKSILIKLDYGDCTNQKLSDDLKRAIRYNENELSEDIGRFKIYEENENSTPTEYVMVVLWTHIFPDILDAGNRDKILERYAKHENKFQVKLSNLLDYLNKLYTLPTYASSDIYHHNDRRQFKSKIVKDAMNFFIAIQLATVTGEENGDITYEVHHKPLPEKHELEYFLKKIYEINKDKPKELDSSGTEKLSKFLNL